MTPRRPRARGRARRADGAERRPAAVVLVPDAQGAPPIDWTVAPWWSLTRRTQRALPVGQRHQLSRAGWLRSLQARDLIAAGSWAVRVRAVADGKGVLHGARRRDYCDCAVPDDGFVGGLSRRSPASGDPPTIAALASWASLGFAAEQRHDGTPGILRALAGHTRPTTCGCAGASPRSPMSTRATSAAKRRGRRRGHNGLRVRQSAPRAHRWTRPAAGGCCSDGGCTRGAGCAAVGSGAPDGGLRGVGGALRCLARAAGPLDGHGTPARSAARRR